MAEYNSAYTGAQIDGAVGAVIENKSTWDNKVSAVTITIPKGRVRGDVDGDGKWTESDVKINQKIIVGNIKPTDIEKWCADVNGDGYNTVADTGAIQSLVNGEIRYPDVMADYYGNWTFDATSTNWSADIAISNVNSGTDLILNAFDADVYANLVKGEITNTGVTVYMKMPPVSDVVCVGEVFTGSGRVMVSGWNESDVFFATYGETTLAELDAAYTAGKALFLLRNSGCSSAAVVKPGTDYTFGPDYWGYVMSCDANGAWSRTKWGGGKLPPVTTSDNGKFLRVVSGAWKADEVLPSDIGAAAESPSHQVTLTASGWNSTTKQQTVTCADILADVTKQEIHAMPVDTSADNAYDAASIRPVAQAANSLTFYAETIPTADINVYVAIHPLKFS